MAFLFALRGFTSGGQDLSSITSSEWHHISVDLHPELQCIVTTNHGGNSEPWKLQKGAIGCDYAIGG